MHARFMLRVKRKVKSEKRNADRETGRLRPMIEKTMERQEDEGTQGLYSGKGKGKGERGKEGSMAGQLQPTKAPALGSNKPSHCACRYCQIRTGQDRIG